MRICFDVDGKGRIEKTEMMPLDITTMPILMLSLA